MARVGYARVSARDQNLDVQISKLADCHKLFTDKHTGTTADRPGFEACLRYLREGDTLVVTRLDRLARSTLHLCQLAEHLRQEGIDLEVLDQHIETKTATGRLLFNILGAIGQFETELRHERQMEGILAAQAKGIHFGRSKQLNPEQVAELHVQRQLGRGVAALAKHYGMTRTSIYRYLEHKPAGTIGEGAAD